MKTYWKSNIEDINQTHIFDEIFSKLKTIQTDINLNIETNYNKIIINNKKVKINSKNILN
jgi:hypothetical protein